MGAFEFAVHYSYLIPLLPLAGAAIAGFGGARLLKRQSHWPIWLGVAASAALSFILLFGFLGKSPTAPAQTLTATPSAQTAIQPLAATSHWYTWIEVGDKTHDWSNSTVYHTESAQGRAPTFFQADASAYLDPLSAMMLCIITGIGLLIAIFSQGYMAGEAGYFRFFAYIGLFIFSMTCLVMGDNLLMLYLGWEGVGLCSYLLIGYYYEKPAAREAGKKAFLVNRIGDFAFGIGILLSFMAFGTLSYFGNGHGNGLLERSMDVLPNISGSFQEQAKFWIPFCLMLGAFGKSAQFPLYVWLPDAMEGPTPVSALIHAATMVTAGVYMIARCGPLFVGNYIAIRTIACVGALTAIGAATIALRQFDLKKVFAYSTISQLGYMFVGVAVLAPVAGLFHLLTHAFFKALLFLTCGVVMHATAGELDMRKMSGLKRVLPKTRWLMLIGCLALAGCPLFSGFFSKDEIVGATRPVNFGLWVTLLITAFMTAYYTFRLYFRVFEGPLLLPSTPAPGHGHGGEDPHAHGAASDSAIKTDSVDSSGVDVGQTHAAPAGHHGGKVSHEPIGMMLPLIILAIGAALAGYLNTPWAPRLGEFLGRSPSLQLTYQVAIQTYGSQAVSAELFGLPGNADGATAAEWATMIVGGAISLLGIALAFVLHLRDRARADQLADALQPMTGWVEAKFYVDAIYQRWIVEPLRWLGRGFFAFDDFIVDGIVNLFGWIPRLGGALLQLFTQRGYLQGYASAMLFGIALIVLMMLVYH